MTTAASAASLTLALVSAVSVLLLPASAGSAGIRGATFAPHAAFTQDVGTKHAVGYFSAVGGACAVTLMLTDRVFSETALPGEAARLRFTVAAGADATIEASDGAGLSLGCAGDGESLIVQGFGDV